MVKKGGEYEMRALPQIKMADWGRTVFAGDNIETPSHWKFTEHRPLGVSVECAGLSLYLEGV